MAKRLNPRLDILPAPQRRLWDELAEVPEPFILYGGTAIASTLATGNQRTSTSSATRRSIPGPSTPRSHAFKDQQSRKATPNTLTCLVDRGGPVKVSFLGVPNLARVRAPFTTTGTPVRVADLFDLAGTKAAVVQARAQQKDYIDIDAMMAAGIDLPTHLAAACLVYGASFAPTETLKALTYFGDGDLPALKDAIKRRLTRAAAAVDALRLPSLRRTAPRRQQDRDTDR